jgi:hypothetical protein
VIVAGRNEPVPFFLQLTHGNRPIVFAYSLDVMNSFSNFGFGTWLMERRATAMPPGKRPKSKFFLRRFF